MNHMELQYFKTDKNGTKYFYDWKCPRCAGAGFADKWAYTGRVCYACGGTGKRHVAKIVKEYSPEYWAKLEARRQARAAKYAEDHAEEIAAEKAERERREAKWRKEENARICARLGCGDNGIGYILTGDTYPVKDTIKANGGKWIYQTWVAPVQIEAKGVNAVRIDLNKFINDYGFISDDDARDAIWEIGGKR